MTGAGSVQRGRSESETSHDERQMNPVHSLVSRADETMIQELQQKFDSLWLGGESSNMDHLNATKSLIRFLRERTVHVWCRFKTLPAELFPFFTKYYTEKWKPLRESDLQHKLFFCLRDCPRCVDEYHRAKTEMLCDRMKLKCGDKQIEQTREFLDELCATRVTEWLRSYIGTPTNTPAPAVVYEILTQSDVLMQSGALSLIPRLIETHGESVIALCKREKRVMPSLVVLLTHPDRNVRGFAMSVFNTVGHPFSESEFASSYSLVKSILSDVSSSNTECKPFGFRATREDLWFALDVILREDVEDAVLSRILDDEREFVLRMLESVSKDPVCAIDALNLFVNMAERIGRPLLLGRPILSIDVFLKTLIEFFFTQKTEIYSQLVLRALVDYVDIYPFRDSKQTEKYLNFLLLFFFETIHKNPSVDASVKTLARKNAYELFVNISSAREYQSVLQCLIAKSGRLIINAMEIDLFTGSGELLELAMKVMHYCLRCSIVFFKPCYESYAELNPVCPLIWDLFTKACKAHPDQSELVTTFWSSVRTAADALIIPATSHSVKSFVSFVNTCSSVLAAPKEMNLLAPYAFVFCMLGVESRVSGSLQSYVSKCSFSSVRNFLHHFAKEHPVPYLGGASVLCQCCNEVKMEQWKGGWFDFFESLSICLECFPEDQITQKRVQKTLKKSILPFASSLFDVISKQGVYCEACESGMIFFTDFFNQVVISVEDIFGIHCDKCPCGSFRKSESDICLCGHSNKHHVSYSGIQESFAKLIRKCKNKEAVYSLICTFSSSCKTIGKAVSDSFMREIKAFARDNPNFDLKDVLNDKGLIHPSKDDESKPIPSPKPKHPSNDDDVIDRRKVIDPRFEPEQPRKPEPRVPLPSPERLSNVLKRIVFEWSANPKKPLDADEHSQRGGVYYKTPEEYEKAFKGLFLKELHSQLFEERSVSRDGRSTEFILESITEPSNVNTFDRMTYVRVKKSDQELNRGHNFLSENDVVWLSSEKEPSAGKVLAIVGEKTRIPKVRNADVVTLDFIFVGDEEKRQRMRSLFLVSRVAVRFVAVRFGSISTALREWYVLHIVKHMKLADSILLPQRHLTQPELRCDVPKDRMDSLLTKCGLNQSQRNAVLFSVSGTGFRLVQGPPGTGKTETIVAIVSALLLSSNRRTIMVCAPSNAAVDEIAMRLLNNGFWTLGVDGCIVKKLFPKGKLLRVGVPDLIHPDLRCITLEELLKETECSDPDISRYDKRIENANDKCEMLFKQLDEVKNALDLVCKKVNEYSAKGEDVLWKSELRKKSELTARKKGLQTQIVASKNETREYSQKRTQRHGDLYKNYINKADVICCTLSFSGAKMFSGGAYGTVIVDEAAQSVELETLIPLQHKTERCIMVGDPVQLPATIINRDVAKSLVYSRSLFQRLMECKHSPVFLNTQYRMHPHISAFPSSCFYGCHLQNGENVLQRRTEFYRNRVFAPFMVFDLPWSRESKRSNSFENREEADFCCMLIEQFRHSEDPECKNSIGVITPYKGQCLSLQHKLKSSKNVVVNTVDGFQGREEDIILFSCVRGESEHGGIGFLDDLRRMNVGITRAKRALWVVGNGKQLKVSELWQDLFAFARKNNVCVVVDPDESRAFAKLTEKVKLLEYKPAESQLDATSVSPRSISVSNKEDFVMPKIVYPEKTAKPVVRLDPPPNIEDPAPPKKKQNKESNSDSKHAKDEHPSTHRENPKKNPEPKHAEEEFNPQVLIIDEPPSTYKGPKKNRESKHAKEEFNPQDLIIDEPPSTHKVPKKNPERKQANPTNPTHKEVKAPRPSPPGAGGIIEGNIGTMILPGDKQSGVSAHPVVSKVPHGNSKYDKAIQNLSVLLAQPPLRIPQGKSSVHQRQSVSSSTVSQQSSKGGIKRPPSGFN